MKHCHGVLWSPRAGVGEISSRNHTPLGQGCRAGWCWVTALLPDAAVPSSVLGHPCRALCCFFYSGYEVIKFTEADGKKSVNVLLCTVRLLFNTFLLIVKRQREVRGASSAGAYFYFRKPKIDTQKSNPDKTLIYLVKNTYYTHFVSPGGADPWHSFPSSLGATE